MSSVLASNLIAIVATDRLTKVGKDFSRFLIIRSSPSVNELCRFAKPRLWPFYLGSDSAMGAPVTIR